LDTDKVGKVPGTFSARLPGLIKFSGLGTDTEFESDGILGVCVIVLRGIDGQDKTEYHD
jgi:hypothetical protein